MTVAGSGVAETLVTQFSRMVERDGGSLELLGTEGKTITVGYRAGADPTCEDGACILPHAELEALMRETLGRRDPDPGAPSPAVVGPSTIRAVRQYRAVQSGSRALAAQRRESRSNQWPSTRPNPQ